MGSPADPGAPPVRENPRQPRRADFVDPLHKPIYVVNMNWWHWSDAVRLKWLRNFREALEDSLRRVDVLIKDLEW